MKIINTADIAEKLKEAGKLAQLQKAKIKRLEASKERLKFKLEMVEGDMLDLQNAYKNPPTPVAYKLKCELLGAHNARLQARLDEWRNKAVQKGNEVVLLQEQVQQLREKVCSNPDAHN